jgi:GNAT superfamily N-acetyltransferase
VVAFVAPWSGKPEVSYWLGREFWGKGIATTALRLFLSVVAVRPLYARAARDNAASIRVLEKCGFTIAGSARGFANARGAEVEEMVLVLKSKTSAVVTLDRVADLSEADREGIRRLSQAVYPPEQMVDWSERHVEWSKPELCVRLRSEDGELLSFVGVYVRDAEFDGLSVRLGGVGNVKTHPQARGQGLAAIGIQRAVEFFRTQPGIELALLVCEPQLLGYYARLGWQEFGGRLLVRQHGVSSEFTFNRVMIYSVRMEQPVSGTIDLCGSPW